MKKNMMGENRDTLHNSYKTRPTIGYLAPSIHGGNLAQWSGIVDSAQARGVNLISFSGFSLHDPRAFQAQANLAYDLVDPTNVQGVIAWVSSIGNYVDDEVIKAFCDRYRTVPLVSIGKVIAGTTSLLMDSYQGMCEAMTHLIEVHGYRRIAFIRGPENHFYAKERYRAYVETLEAYGIPFDPQLVTPSRDWERATGAEMVQMLFDERGLLPQTNIEAIVAANDDLVLGGLEVLRTRKIRVPDEVALVGFNHSIEGRASTPPLTSVAVPFYEVGYQAVEVLLALMAGEQVPSQITVPGHLVVRQSCGCQSPAVKQATIELPASINVQETGPKGIAEVLATQRTQYLADIDDAVSELGGKLEPETAEQWMDLFVAELEGGPAGTFLASLDDTLHQAIISGGDLLAYHGVVSVLSRYFTPHVKDTALLHANSLLQQARIVIGEAAQRKQTYQQAQAERHSQTLAEIGASLIMAFDLEELMNVLAEGLPRLNMPSAYLALYEDPQSYTYPDSAPEWSRLVLAFDERARVAVGDGGERFRTRRLLPASIPSPDRNRTLAVMPLYFREQQLGFGIFEVGVYDGLTSERLRGQISSALQGALLMQQVQQHAAQLDSIVTETLATSEEMRVTISETSRQAQAVASAAQQSVDISKTGQDAVADTVAGMEAIQRQVSDIARSILALSERTQQIGQIISAVEEIANESRMLALNASIEAARAGDEGLGFAVVAREMRHLAGQSREATTKVSGILNEIQRAANSAVMVTKEGSKGALLGMELANQAGISIRDLTAVIEEAAQVAIQIAASTHQQTNAMDQLVLAMKSIKRASAQTTASIKEAGISTESTSV
jgi:DNA-binding LacI/PurR family transcriptional regulator